MKSGIRNCVLVALGGLAGLSFFLTPTALGQKRTVTKPNLTGQWVLDKSKKNTKGVVEDLTMLIQQDESEIRITRRAASDREERIDKLIYYTDGRGETNSILATTPSDGKFEIRSVTKWERDKLVIRTNGAPLSA